MISSITFADLTHKRMLIAERFLDCIPVAVDWKPELLQEGVIKFERLLNSGLPIRIMPLPDGESWMGKPTTKHE